VRLCRQAPVPGRVIDSSPFAAAIIDSDGRYTYWSISPYLAGPGADRRSHAKSRRARRGLANTHTNLSPSRVRLMIRPDNP